MPRRSQSKQAAKQRSSASTTDWMLATAILVMAALFPLINAALPIIYDEHYTLREYASTSFHHIATTYDLPNNHIGFTLLLRVWMFVLDVIGPREYLKPSLYLLRLPVVLAAFVACGAGFLLARKLVSRDVVVASLVSLLLISAPVVAYHSFQLRGYMPCIAYITVALTVIAYSSSMRWYTVVALLGSAVFLAQYTLPTNIWFLLPLIFGTALLALAAVTTWLSQQPTPTAPQRPRATDADAHRPIWRRVIGNRALFSALVTAPAALALALLCWTRVWVQLQAQNTHRTTSFHDFLSALRTHAQLLAEGAGPLPGVWLNWAMVIAGTTTVLICALRGNSFARHTLLLAVPIVWLCVPLAAFTSTSAFSRNFTIAAPAFAILGAWSVIGASLMFNHVIKFGIAPSQEKDTPPVSAAWPSRIAVGVLALLAMGNGWRSMSAVWRDHRPDQAIAAVVGDNRPQSVIVHETDADAVALDYYAYRAGRQQPISYDIAPRDLCQRVPTVYLLAASDGTLEKMLMHFNIPKAGTDKLQHLGQYGKVRVARYSAAR
ncbi:MAG: hypothetical protein ACR2IE_11940 [Candidatus Sumerlaeaceae bacterium]